MAAPQRFRPRALKRLVLAALVCGGTVRAQVSELPPPAPIEGVPAGPCYLTPFLGLGVSYETNPFYQPVAQADSIGRANVALGVMFPFHNSYFRVGYDGIFRRFKQTSVTHPDSRDLLAELSLLFSTFDRFVILATETSGASEALNFDGGETTYNGTPFRYATYTLGAERSVPGHFGYQATAVWNDLTFDQTTASFFEFHGYDATVDLHVPASSSLWVVAGAKVRRFDHMKADDPTGAVFRKEQADTIRAGIQGILGTGKSYHAVLAYDRADYPGGVGSNFKGLVGDASIELALGPSTSLTIDAARRRWSSFYGDNNYYVADTLGTGVQHKWIGGSEVGAALGIGNSVYPDPLSVASGGPRRRDRGLSLDAHATWEFVPHCGLRFSYSDQFRHSNVDGVEYDARTIGVQVVMGWR